MVCGVFTRGILHSSKNENDIPFCATTWLTFIIIILSGKASVKRLLFSLRSKANKTIPYLGINICDKTPRYL